MATDSAMSVVMEKKFDVVGEDAEIGEVKSAVELPKQWGNPTLRKLRYAWASSYRKTFTLIFAINLAVFIALVATAPNGRPEHRDIGTAASANLLAAILFRQENFLNVVYEVFARAPHSWPLSVRKRFAKVFHYGGVHSGCGVAAVVWYIMYTVEATLLLIEDKNTHGDILANMVTSWVLVTMFIVILAGAHPWFRRNYHDHFEAFHRFAGWTALVNFWVHNVFSAAITARETGDTTGMALLKTPSFWTILVSTACTVLSWSRLRLRKVYPEKLSDHATRLHFRYAGMPSFYGVKLADRPLLEWHAFATIPDIDETTGKTTGFSVVVSNAGDWTNKQIMASGERKLWIRGNPLHGLLYTSRLFKRIVLVATGSGIGPCLSLMHANITPTRVYWSTRDPQQNYGRSVVNAVKKADPRAVIWNTSTQGRGTIVQSVYKLVKESDAEAVFIISNPKVTEMVVFGMQSRGVPAYGAIFDS
ncbi:uncharacterized protein N0V89_003359 [Didymosphaeria variabile]|uniref:Nonribosomal peptide synthetase 12 n=1 Tax=Didymosphaeria variabile TaxID=1932322 RepID=A0A9W9CFB5_9PLEO|nr:uncharacterized protein N0V89_003359 [Didymosphaeria variabile]KAJ4358775.1 hypothetical protein N0V89_003359 [Didymosphaeria variabile]